MRSEYWNRFRSSRESCNLNRYLYLLAQDKLPIYNTQYCDTRIGLLKIN